MKLCSIVPISWLGRVNLYTNTHLILAQEVFKDTRYSDFYRKCCIAGDYIIVDNGAFEQECVTTEQVLEAANKIYVPGRGGVEVVAPEVMGDVDASLALLKEFVLLMKKRYITYFHLMVVLHGKTTEEVLEMHQIVRAMMGSKYPITWGVPKYMGAMRPNVVKGLLSLTQDPIHILGLAGASDRRLPFSSQIRSLDTSYAATVALNDLSAVPLDGSLTSPKRPSNFFGQSEPTTGEGIVYKIAYEWLRQELHAEV